MAPNDVPADPRILATRERVLATAAEILRRDGYTGLTMERVASESGAALPIGRLISSRS